MIRREVQSVVVVRGELYLGTVRNPIAETDEDVDDLPHGSRQGVDRANRGLGARERHVDPLALPSVLELGGLERLPAFVEGGFDRALDAVGQLADDLAILCFELAEPRSD